MDHLRAALVATVIGAIASACAHVPLRGLAPLPSLAAEEWYYVADDGVRHYVTEFGRGDTVIVLHGGFGAEHSYLLDAVSPMADRFHFVLYDQRGSLRSPAPDSTITVDRLVRDLDGLRQQLGLEKATLLAHSMGTVLSSASGLQHMGDLQPGWCDAVVRSRRSAGYRPVPRRGSVSHRRSRGEGAKSRGRVAELSAAH